MRDEAQLLCATVIKPLYSGNMMRYPRTGLRQLDRSSTYNFEALWVIKRYVVTASLSIALLCMMPEWTSLQELASRSSSRALTVSIAPRSSKTSALPMRDAGTPLMAAAPRASIPASSCPYVSSPGSSPRIASSTGLERFAERSVSASATAISPSASRVINAHLKVRGVISFLNMSRCTARHCWTSNTVHSPCLMSSRPTVVQSMLQ
ncbi:hypothetical protein F5883DRAFT_568612 [Diaporthe sp. PMI_573]|nr:hypothetical protein F5883DRAFT_568612 [Diaporthaceae sp. PMI_573]